MASAFDSLTPRQAKFVTSYVRLGGKPQAAGLAAGYSGRSAHVSASKLLRLPKILAAIREETERRLTANVALAAEALVNLAETAESESVRLQAAQALLDRGGLLLVGRSEHRVIVQDERSDAELRARIAALAGELGLNGPLLDVTPAALPAPAEGGGDG